MELDKLKNIWNEQEEQPETEYSKSELMDLLNTKMDEMEQSIRRRDRLEIIACAVLIAIFGYMFFTASSLRTQLDSAIIIVSSVYIIYKLNSAQFQRVSNPLSVDIPMDEHLKRELQQVQQQREMLKNVAWWCIAPLTLGLLIMTLGGDAGLGFKAGYIVFLFLMGVAVWWLNQRAVRRKFEPLISEIKEAIEVVENQ